MPTKEAAQARREAAELAARLSVEAHRTERVRVILAGLLFPTVALITVWLLSLGVGVTEWLTVVVAPVLTVVIGFVLSGRVVAVAKATSDAVVATGEVIDANRLHASAAAARAATADEHTTEEGPPPATGGGPRHSAEGGPVVGPPTVSDPGTEPPAAQPPAVLTSGSTLLPQQRLG